MLLINFIFDPTFFHIASYQIFKKLCDSNKSRIIFSEKRFSTTWPFPILEIELIIIKYSNLFIKMLFRKIVFL